MVKTVQSATTTIAGGSSSNTTTVTSVDTTKSFIELRSVYADTAATDNYIAVLTNATTVTVSRATTTGSVGVAWTLIEWD